MYLSHFSGFLRDTLFAIKVGKLLGFLAARSWVCLRRFLSRNVVWSYIKKKKGKKNKKKKKLAFASCVKVWDVAEQPR